MSSEDSLLEIIKSLADQITSRDVRIRDQLQQSDEQLDKLKSQYETVRAEREDLRMQRDKLEGELQTVKLVWSSEVNALKQQIEELVKERVEVRTTYELEKAELRNKVQHQVQLLSKSQEDLNESRLRCNTAMEDLKTQSEKWSPQLSQMLVKLDQLSESWQKLGTVSSNTIIPSVSPAKQSVAPRSAIHSSTPVSPRVVPMGANSTPKRQNNASPVRNNISVVASGSPKRPNSRTREQLEAGSETREPAVISRSIPAHARGVFKVEYEVKEEDHEDEHRSLFAPRVATYCNAAQVLPQGNEGEPNVKRRRIDSRTRSARRIDDQDDQDEDEYINSSEVANDSSLEEPEDQDEMAIGAEEDPKEIYGHRKVNVPKKMSRLHARSNGSGTSSGTKRKVGPPGLNSSPNGRQSGSVQTRR